MGNTIVITIPLVDSGGTALLWWVSRMMYGDQWIRGSVGVYGLKLLIGY